MKFSQLYPGLKSIIIIAVIATLLIFSVSVYLCFSVHNDMNVSLVVTAFFPLTVIWFMVKEYQHIKALIIKHHGPFGEIIEAWHFARIDRCLGYGDGREIIEGETLTVKEKPELCLKGLHASRKIIDALENARGSIICRVEVSGEILEDENKLVGQSRKCLWWIDADKILHEFACKCAERALKNANIETPELWNVIKFKRKWLTGEVTTEAMVAARSIAEFIAVKNCMTGAYADLEAVWLAVDSVAWLAADSADFSSPSVAWLAAKHAADSVSMSATSAMLATSAVLVERDWQEKTLLSMIEERKMP